MVSRCYVSYTPHWLYDHISDNEELFFFTLALLLQWDRHVFLLCRIFRCAGVWIIVLGRRGILSNWVSLLLVLELGSCHSLLPDVVSPSSSTTGNELSCGCTSPTCQGVPSMTTICGQVIPVTQPLANFNMHHPYRFFTQTASSSLYQADVTWLGRGTTSILFTQILYECSRLMGTKGVDTLSLGVMLCQYAASIMRQLFCTAIHFIVQWHLSTIPFPDRFYVQRGRNQMSHLSMNHLNCWLQKALSLLTRISTEIPHLKNTDSNCWITCAASCQMKNHVGLQSIRVKK